MKTQLRIEGQERSSVEPASKSVRRPRRPAAPISEGNVERARRRIASGYYDSDVCLDITVRRIVRALKRPVVEVVRKSPIALPGRSAQKQAGGTKSQAGRRD